MEPGRAPCEPLRGRQHEYVKNARRSSLQRKVQNARSSRDSALDLGSADILLSHLDLYSSEALKRSIVEALREPAHLGSVDAYVAQLRADDAALNHAGLIQLRKLLTRHYEVLIQHLIDSDCLARIIAFAQREEQPHLVLEAAWCLTNLALGDCAQTAFLVQKGAIPVFLRASQSPFPQIAEQGIWGIGNVCSDSLENRQSVLDAGAVAALGGVYARGHPVLCKYVAWVFSLLCKFRARDEPPDAALPALRLVMEHAAALAPARPLELEDCLTGASGLLSAATLELFARREFVLLLCGYYALASAAAAAHLEGLQSAHHVMGMLCALQPAAGELLLEAGAVAQFSRNLQVLPQPALLREVCWALGQFVGGEPKRARAACDTPGLLDALFRLAAGAAPAVSAEAFAVIASVCRSKRGKALDELVARGVLGLFGGALAGGATKRTLTVLDAASCLLEFYHRSRGWAEVLRTALDTGLAAGVARLQLDGDAEVYFRANALTYKYFPVSN